MVFDRRPECPEGHAFNIHHFRGGKARRAFLWAVLGAHAGGISDRRPGASEAGNVVRLAVGEL